MGGVNDKTQTLDSQQAAGAERSRTFFTKAAQFQETGRFSALLRY
jgi:hypothetical protein